MSELKTAPAATDATTDLSTVSVSRNRGLRSALLGARSGSLWTGAVLVVLVLVFGLSGSGFFSQASWVATSSYAVIILILALGQTFVVISGGIDLSQGSVLGFSAMTGAAVMRAMTQGGGNPILAIVIGSLVIVVIGGVVGLVNGILVTKAHITPFIATLATLSAFQGGISIINRGTAIFELPPEVGQIGSFALFDGWLPILVLVAIVAAVASAWFLNRSRFGVRTFAIGSNREAALRTGIRVDRHIIRVYVLAGLMGGLAGICYVMRFSSVDPTAGSGNELTAIAAVVIGGASLMGGRGSIVGTTIGAAIISVIVTGLITMNVPTFWQLVAVGAILAGAAYVDWIRGRVVRR
jgi:ribose transport system permease protein